MKSMLALIGFDHVVVARNADSAMSACRKTDFDFILCDYNLGIGRDGYQLFEALKAEHSLKHSCCFIVVSGERHRQSVYGMIEFLPDDYLLKPFSYAELERRIGRAFEVKRALKYAYQMIAEENYPEAIQACDVALDQHPLHHAYINRLKGELLVKVGHYKEAEALYKEVLLFRDLPWAKLGIAVAKGYQAQDTEAEGMLTELTRKYPTERLHTHLLNGEELAVEHLWIPNHSLLISGMCAQWFGNIEEAIRRWLSVSNTVAFSVLLDGSFQAWEVAHEDTGQTSGLRPLPCDDDLQDIMNALVAEGIAASTAHHTKNFLDHHPDGLSFARSLRAIGADQPRVNHTPVNLRKVISALGEACTMNYHIGFYYLERP